MNVFVIPSWFPPNGGSFFVEQTKVLSNTAKQTVLYIEPVYLKNLLKNISLIKKLAGVKTEEIEGVTVLRKYYLYVPKLTAFNFFMLSFLYIKLYKTASKKYGTPDLLHVHSSIWGGLFASEIKKKYSIPYIITEHRSRFVDNRFASNQFKETMKFKKYLRKAFLNASMIITVSDSLQKNIKKVLEEKYVPMKTIPNICDEELFCYNKERKKERENFVFITVAALTWLKGTHILIEAFAELFKTDKNIELQIVGDGPERSKLEKLATDLGVNKKVRFLGQQNRVSVAEYMKSADVFVLPTKYEAFGIVYIEALFSGLPIIGTRGSGGPENIIENNKNGYIIDIDDLDGLRDAMEKSIRNYINFDKEEIIRDAKEKFGQKKFIELYNEIYKEVSAEMKFGN